MYSPTHSVTFSKGSDGGLTISVRVARRFYFFVRGVAPYAMLMHIAAMATSMVYLPMQCLVIMSWSIVVLERV